jgi:hypothetical protein
MKITGPNLALIGILNLSNPSNRLMVLGLAQTLTDTKISGEWDKRRPALKAHNLTAICEPIF